VTCLLSNFNPIILYAFASASLPGPLSHIQVLLGRIARFGTYAAFFFSLGLWIFLVFLGATSSFASVNFSVRFALLCQVQLLLSRVLNRLSLTPFASSPIRIDPSLFSLEIVSRLMSRPAYVVFLVSIHPSSCVFPPRALKAARTPSFIPPFIQV